MADERMPWTAENIQANAPAFLQALIDAGIDPSLTPDEVMTPGLREQVLMAEGRERARPRYQQALDRAQRYGYQQLADRIENLVEAEAQRHARRGLRRSGGIGSDVVAAPSAQTPSRSAAPPLPVGGTSGPMPMTRPAPGAASPLPSDGALAPPLPVAGSFSPMPPALLDRNRRPPPLSPLVVPPLQPETAEGALMPQSQAEADNIAEGMGWLRGAVSYGAPFALAGPMAGGASMMANLATRFPRLATMLTGGAALTGQSTAAGPQKPQQKPGATQAPAPKGPQSGADPQLQQLLESDPVLRRLQTQIDEQDAIANASAQAYPKSARDGARTRAADLTKEFNARLGELSRANLPFDQAYPWLAQNRGLVNFLAPAAVGVATRTAGNLLSRVGPGRWERALSDADRALRRGDERAHEHFMSRAARFEPRPQGTASRIAHATAPAIAGGTVGAELSLLPYQHNATNAPLGSPQRAEAEAMMGDPSRFIPRAAFGFGIGALGGVTGGHLPNVGPGFRPPPAGPTPQTPLPPTMVPTPAAPPPVPAATPLPQPPIPLAPPAPPPPTPGLGAMWPAPPSAVPGPPPGLASIRSPRPSGPSPTDSPPAPAILGAPPRLPLPPLADRRARPNPDDPRGHWVPRDEPVVPGVTSYVSPQGRNEVYMDAGGRWQRRLPNGRTQFISGPPPKYRRISQAEPNLLAQYG